MQVGEKELDDLCHGSLGEMYEAVHTVHPGRGAKGEHRVTTDGVAILLRRARLRLEGREHVEFMAGKAGFEGEVHQHALLATARDIETGAQVPCGTFFAIEPTSNLQLSRDRTEPRSRLSRDRSCEHGGVS